MIQVRVPATTANLGPGFDCMGLALSMYLTVRITKAQQLCFTGCDIAYQNKDNYVYKGFEAVFKHLHKNVPPICIDIQSDIFSTRGLGSSAACIVAGLFGANAYLSNPLSKDDLFMVATEIEGHPDNVAPAIYGGLTASFIDSGKPFVVKFEIDKRFQFGAFIPTFELSTAKARAVLPKQIPYQDAIYNVSRVAVLGKALENYQCEMVSKAMQDCMHEPYRKTLIPQSDDIYAHSMKHGAIALYLSGAGPTMMVVASESSVITALQKDKHFAPTWQFIPLEIDQLGVQVKEG